MRCNFFERSTRRSPFPLEELAFWVVLKLKGYVHVSSKCANLQVLFGVFLEGSLIDSRLETRKLCFLMCLVSLESIFHHVLYIHSNQHDLSLDLLQAAVYRLCNIVCLELHFLDTGSFDRKMAVLMNQTRLDLQPDSLHLCQLAF